MIKKMFLSFLCLYLFLLVSSCKKTPTTPDISEAGFPIISYFFATPSQISVGESSGLFWFVCASTPFYQDTLKVFVRWGYDEGGVVERVGTMEVHPTRTTTYRLTAYVGIGGRNSVSEFVIVEVMKE